MTAQLSRIVYRIGNPENDQHHFTDQKDHADIAKKNGYEVAEYALAGMNSDPVAYIFKHPSGKLFWALTDESNKGRKDVMPVYAAPPAPVAVPDERKAFEEFMEKRFKDSIDRRQVKNGDGEYMAWDMQVAWIAWQKRAAMLKSGHVTAATVPDGWKLVPVEPTAEMISSGITAHYERSQIQIHDRPAPGPMECGYVAMLAASPSAPDQEV